MGLVVFWRVWGWRLGSGAHVIFEEVEYFSRPEKRTMLITVMLNVSRGNVRGGIVS
jgi:hypothetical protein